jgi:hypothetical protein
MDVPTLPHFPPERKNLVYKVAEKKLTRSAQPMFNCQPHTESGFSGTGFSLSVLTRVKEKLNRQAEACPTNTELELNGKLFLPGDEQHETEDDYGDHE